MSVAVIFLICFVVSQVNGDCNPLCTSTSTTKYTNSYNCTTYYKCVNGKLNLFTCPTGKVWNCITNSCGSSLFSSCCIKDPNWWSHPTTYNCNLNQALVKEGDRYKTNVYYECVGTFMEQQYCLDGQTFNVQTKMCLPDDENLCTQINLEQLLTKSLVTTPKPTTPKPTTPKPTTPKPTTPKPTTPKPTIQKTTPKVITQKTTPKPTIQKTTPKPTTSKTTPKPTTPKTTSKLVTTKGTTLKVAPVTAKLTTVKVSTKSTAKPSTQKTTAKAVTTKGTTKALPNTVKSTTQKVTTAKPTTSKVTASKPTTPKPATSKTTTAKV